MIVPLQKDADIGPSSNIPPEIQLTLDTAVQQQWNITQSLIMEFATEKRQEFKSWREQARRQASMIARVAESTSRSSDSTSTPALTIATTIPKTTAQNIELFQKSPVTQYSHPGESPLAAASLTRSHSERPSSSPPLSKTTPPLIPLSSSLKSPGSSNFSKPVKRVMFQDPPDEEVHSDIDEAHVDDLNVSASLSAEPTISVDGKSIIEVKLTLDVLFDFDESIPGIPLESDVTEPSISHSSSSAQPVRSPSCTLPLSRFRRRSVEKYELPGGDEDPVDPPNIPSKLNGFQTEDAVGDNLSTSSSKPIAITPPPRSFLAKGLGIDEDEDEGGMKGHIERISLKNTRRGSISGFADQGMLWDIPGDYYRSVPS